MQRVALSRSSAYDTLQYRLIAAPHIIVTGPRISASVSREKMLHERFQKHLLSVLKRPQF